MGEPENEPSATGEIAHPATEESRGANRPPEKRSDVSLASLGGRILVIDDNAVGGEWLSAMFTAAGYKVECRKRKDVSLASPFPKTDLVVFDALVPPPGQDIPLGVGQVLDSLGASAVEHRTPVLVLTAQEFAEPVLSGSGFLVQRVKLDELMSRVQEQMAGAKAVKSKKASSESASAPESTSGVEGGKKMPEHPQPKHQNNTGIFPVWVYQGWLRHSFKIIVGWIALSILILGLVAFGKLTSTLWGQGGILFTLVLTVFHLHVSRHLRLQAHVHD